jgi:hypothetical protein
MREVGGGCPLAPASLHAAVDVFQLTNIDNDACPG